MNFIFNLQGEGRPNMTQAIELGKMGAPVFQFESPNFSKDDKQKSINLSLTLFQILFKSNTYRKNIKILSEIITYENPGVIINFYNFLADIYKFWYRPKLKFIYIAHQYLTSQPKFTLPSGKITGRIIFKLANQITRHKAAKVLALSFQYIKDNRNSNIISASPLLRERLLKLNIKTEDYLLIYMVNSGYGEEIEFFHRRNPNMPIVCFWYNNKTQISL